MTREDVVEFARRDWGQVARAKDRFWRDLKAGRSAAEVLGIADQLRHEARQMRSGWPSVHERAEDAAVHQRVGEALRAVRVRPR